MEEGRLRWWRLVGVWLAGSTTPWALGWLLRPELTVWADAGQATFVDLLVATSAWVLVGCALWFWIAVTTVSLSALRGRRLRWAGTPTWLRRGLVVACGLAVVGLPAGAHADSTLERPEAVDGTSLAGMTVPDIPDTDAQRSPRGSEESSETGGPPAPAPAATERPGQSRTPRAGQEPPRADAAPSGPAAAASPTPPRPSAPAPDSEPPPRETPEPTRVQPAPPARGASVVVRGGDTLWSIARRRSPTATDAQLDRLWREIWEANRDVIGDDPDVIHPGQRLELGEEER